MTTLSTHVLDIERGVPAAGVAVRVLQQGRELASAQTDLDGRIPRLASLPAGTYSLEFHAAAYFEGQGRAAPFLKRVTVEFAIAAGTEHYHVPLLLSPYACTAYRGS